MYNKMLRNGSGGSIRQLWLSAVVLWISTFDVVNAQRPHLANIEKFGDTRSYRTNICDRHRQLISDEVSLPDALIGLNLSVVLTDYSDIPVLSELFSLTNLQYMEESTLFVEILDEVASRAGFLWRKTYATVSLLNTHDDEFNRTWSDLLQWEVNSFDITMGRWDRTTERISNRINFPEGYLDSSIILIQRAVGWSPTIMWSFTLPFSVGLWVAIFVTLGVTGIIYYAMERMDYESDVAAMENDAASVLYTTYMSFTGHIEFQPQTLAARLLTFSISLLALIISAAYTANLASFLVTRNTPEPAYHSLSSAVRGGAKICVWGGVALDDFVTEEYPLANLVRKDAAIDVYTAMLANDGCEVAVVSQSEFDSYVRNSLVNPDCMLSTPGRVEHFVPSGMATTVDTGTYCTSLIGHVLDYHLMEMNYDGFFAEALERFYGRVGTHHCPSNNDAGSVNNDNADEERLSLSVADMTGIFILHGIICILALTLTICKCSRKKVSHRRNRLQSMNNDDDTKSKTMSNIDDKDTMSSESLNFSEIEKVLETTKAPKYDTDSTSASDTTVPYGNGRIVAARSLYST